MSTLATHVMVDADVLVVTDAESAFLAADVRRNAEFAVRAMLRDAADGQALACVAVRWRKVPALGIELAIASGRTT